MDHCGSISDLLESLFRYDILQFDKTAQFPESSQSANDAVNVSEQRSQSFSVWIFERQVPR